MLIRVVKMVFRPGFVDTFMSMMAENAGRIRAFDGCEHLEILQDRNDGSTVFTYSHWRDEHALENYRNSDTFRELWSFGRGQFAEKPAAWSFDRVIHLNDGQP